MIGAVILLIGILAGILILQQNEIVLTGQEKLNCFYSIVCFRRRVFDANCFVMHVFFPEYVAPMIGWEVSL